MLTFQFTEQMTSEIGKVLQRGPYRKVAPILAEIQRQIEAQQKPAEQKLRQRPGERPPSVEALPVEKHNGT
jgi:hypothetical protein